MIARFLSLLGASLVFFASGSAGNATTLFSDDFQTNLSQWAPGQGYTGSAAIVADPLGGGGNALTFGTPTGHGDILTANSFTSTTGTYTISFDFLGICGQPNSCGAWLGDSASGASLASDFPYPRLLALQDTGQWEHVVFDYVVAGPIGLVLEDWNEAAYAGPNVVYFRNLEVTDGMQTPLPPAWMLMISGVAGLLFMNRPKDGRRSGKCILAHADL